MKLDYGQKRYFKLMLKKYLVKDLVGENWEAIGKKFLNQISTFRTKWLGGRMSLKTSCAFLYCLNMLLFYVNS